MKRTHSLAVWNKPHERRQKVEATVKSFRGEREKERKGLPRGIIDEAGEQEGRKKERKSERVKENGRASEIVKDTFRIEAFRFHPNSLTQLSHNSQMSYP